MRNPAGLAWMGLISSLGGQIPGILRQYNADIDTEKKQRAELEVGSVLKNMPKVGTAPAGMAPAEAMDTWLKSSPEDKMKATQILAGQPISTAAKAAAVVPTPPAAPSAGALQSFANPPPPGDLDDDSLSGILDIIGSEEGGGNYAAPHLQAANGLQAQGKYGIVPSVWFKAFPQYGLKETPEDIQRFVNTPALQDAMAKDIVKQLWKEAGGNPRKFAARYYSGADSAIGTPKEWEPQYAYKKQPGRMTREKVRMPSIGEYADKFAGRLAQAGLDTPAATAVAAGGFPYDNAALQAFTKEPPKAKVMPRKVGYQDQERYLLENIKDPRQLELVKDYMSMVSRAADDERVREREDRQEHRENTGDWRQAVIEESRQRLEVWKTKYADSRARSAAGKAARSEALANLKEMRATLQKQLSDMSAWQLNYLKADEEQKEVLASQFPEFFTQKPKTGFFGGTSFVKTLDPNKYEREVLRLRDMINSIGAEIAPKGGVEYIAGEAGKPASPFDYMTPAAP